MFFILKDVCFILGNMWDVHMVALLYPMKSLHIMQFHLLNIFWFELSTLYYHIPWTWPRLFLMIWIAHLKKLSTILIHICGKPHIIKKKSHGWVPTFIMGVLAVKGTHVYMVFRSHNMWDKVCIFTGIKIYRKVRHHFITNLSLLNFMHWIWKYKMFCIHVSCFMQHSFSNKTM